MAKEIIPIKLIIDLNTDGTFRDGVLQYQIQDEGAIDKRRFYTIGIKDGIKIPDLQTIIGDSKIHAEKAESIVSIAKEEMI
jgi:hypothetical protein